MQEYFAAVTKQGVHRRKTEVAVLQTAIAGLFDHKIVAQFNDMLSRVVEMVDQHLPSRQPQDHQEAMKRSMAELSKLTAFLTAR